MILRIATLSYLVSVEERTHCIIVSRGYTEAFPKTKLKQLLRHEWDLRL